MGRDHGNGGKRRTGDRIGPLSFPGTAAGVLLEIDLVPRLELMSRSTRVFGCESERWRVSTLAACRTRQSVRHSDSATAYTINVLFFN